MSVLMMLRVKGDAAKLEQLSQERPNFFSDITTKAKGLGLISHRFWATDDEVLVLDEWETQEGFQTFFAGTPEVGEVMASAGVKEQPVPTFWRPVAVGGQG